MFQMKWSRFCPHEHQVVRQESQFVLSITLLRASWASLQLSSIMLITDPTSAATAITTTAATATAMAAMQWKS